MTIEERLEKLEARFKPWDSAIIGTQLHRTILEQGLGWTLGLGGMRMPKIFFHGPTIENVLEQAEAYVVNSETKQVLLHGELLMGNSETVS